MYKLQKARLNLVSRAHHSAVHTFQGRKASLPRHRRGCRRPATELLPSRLGAFAFSNASYGTTPFPAVRTEGQLLQGAPIPPFRSWITDISIKLIIQIVVSHGPLKSHSANVPLHCLIHASTCGKHVKLALRH